LAIPVAAALTVTIPAPGPGALGLLTGVAGGVLAYIGAAHLLPEAQAEDANKLAGIMFVVTFVITAAGLIAFQHAA
jgi:zinc transporter ZupT